MEDWNKEYEPFCAMLKMAGKVENSNKIQDIVYILQNLGYPSIDENFKLCTNGMYSERLDLVRERIKKYKLIEEDKCSCRISDKNEVDIGKYKKWDECAKQLNKMSTEDISLLSIYFYLNNCGDKGEKAYEKLVELKFIDNRDKFSFLEKNRENLEKIVN